jgi:hypothetical protein
MSSGPAARERFCARRLVVGQFDDVAASLSVSPSVDGSATDGPYGGAIPGFRRILRGPDSMTVLANEPEGVYFPHWDAKREILTEIMGIERV